MDIRSSALVYPGQEVQANQPVLRLGKLDSQAVESRGTQKDIHAHIQQAGGIILAGMNGRVVDITRRGGVIIETRAAIIQGTIGAGNQVAGILTFWNLNHVSQHSGSGAASTSVGIPHYICGSWSAELCYAEPGNEYGHCRYRCQ